MDPRSSAFFNPTASFPPPPRNPDVNWAQLAQRWVAEHAPEQPPMMPSSSGNYHGSRPSFPPQQNPQYGSMYDFNFPIYPENKSNSITFRFLYATAVEQCLISSATILFASTWFKFYATFAASTHASA
jgi:hypothetical protein